MRKKQIATNGVSVALDHGDYPTVAKMVNTTSNYVAQVINGERNAGSKTGKRIIDAAKSLSQTKENLIALAQMNGSDFSSDKQYMIPVNRPMKKA